MRSPVSLPQLARGEEGGTGGLQAEHGENDDNDVHGEDIRYAERDAEEHGQDTRPSTPLTFIPPKQRVRDREARADVPLAIDTFTQVSRVLQSPPPLRENSL